MKPGSPNTSDRREAAAAWHLRLAADDATEHDWRAFETWLSDPLNRNAYDAVEASLEAIEEHSAELARALRGRAGPVPKTPARLPAWAPWLAGGALAAGLAFAVMQIATPRIGPPDALYESSADATRSLTLPDGSGVELNRGSRIRVGFSPGVRRVHLERGEAAFTVRHDPAAPLEVVVGDDVFRDVGTEFNIKSRASGPVITVREGAVDASVGGARPVRVAAGHELRVDRVLGTARLAPAEADAAFAWRDGRMVYHDTALALVIEDINSHGGRPIRITDAAAGAIRFSGVLLVAPADGMAAQLQALLPIKIDDAGAEVRISTR